MVWEYRVSHRQLLLRCPKSTNSSKNLDVMFYNVRYMSLPTTLPHLEIWEPDQKDIAFAENRIGTKVSSEDIYILGSGNQRRLIVAGNAVFAESTIGLFESPFMLPASQL